VLQQVATTPDAVTLEVIRNKLAGIANEMQLTLLKSSFSPVVKEAMDCSAAIFTTNAETLAQALAIPLHLAIMIPSLEEVIKHYPIATMQQGDIYLINDPYHGGTHLPDITLCIPVFASGRVVAFTVTTVHHQDVGGASPGSMPPNATDIFQEGLRLPPLKFHEAGVLNETLDKILRLNSRVPHYLMGDLNAQVAAGRVGERRLGELCLHYGADLIEESFRILLDRSEAMTRAGLRTLPQGTFRYVDWLDNDGVDFDQRVRIEVAVTINDGSFHVDFTGTSAQVRGPINVVPSGAYAAAYYAVRALTGSHIPTNGGCFRMVTITIPEGSLVNPRPPAPVGGRSSSVKRMCGAIISSLAEACPDRVPAASAGLSLIMAFGGRRPDGSFFLVTEMLAAGTGASGRSDGVDCLQTDATNSMNISVEALAMDGPIRIHRFGLRRDSGGVGEFRGGLGIVREYEFLADDISFTYRGERHYTAASGAGGGGPGAFTQSCLIRADGRVEPLESKWITRVSTGDRLIVETAGGAGYGDPARRSAERRRMDVANGKVSDRERAAPTG
jgi:N-methylhydantoinase B/oxoprolinase/acetone carboxylase alpha subunit